MALAKLVTWRECKEWSRAHLWLANTLDRSRASTEMETVVVAHVATTTPNDMTPNK